MKFTVGDKVRIVANNYDHGFAIGEECVIEERRLDKEGALARKINSGYQYWISDDDAVLIQPVIRDTATEPSAHWSRERKTVSPLLLRDFLMAYAVFPSKQGKWNIKILDLDGNALMVSPIENVIDSNDPVADQEVMAWWIHGSERDSTIIAVVQPVPHNDWFGIVRWNNADLEGALEECGIPSTRDNVDELRTACENNHHFTDQMIAAGWDTIHNIIDNVFSGQNGGDQHE